MSWNRKLRRAIECRRDSEIKEYYELSIRRSLIQKNKNGRHPIHYAAKHGHMHVLLKVIELGCYIDLHDYKQRTPLQFAVMYTRTEMMHFLLSMGADVHLLTTSYKLCRNILNAKAFDIMLVLLSHHIIKPDVHGNLLTFVMEKNNGRMITILIAGGYDINETCYDKTPLMNAVQYAGPQEIKILLMAGADITYQNRSGETVFDHVANIPKTFCFWEVDNERIKTNMEVLLTPISSEERDKFVTECNAIRYQLTAPKRDRTLFSLLLHLIDDTDLD
jgi:ankyrin repeat protein